jgi:hypothetical protein
MTPDVSHEAPIEPRFSSLRPWRLCAAAGVAILLAAILAWFPPIAGNRQLGEVFITRNLLIAGGVPWFLQWVGVAVFVWAFSSKRSAAWRDGGKFAMLFTLTLGLVWWGGIAVKFWGKTANEVIFDVAFTSARQHFGEVDLLFEFVGSLVSPLTLNGPLRLDGWRFLTSLASTTLVMVYLLLVGRFCPMNRQTVSVRNALRLLAGFLVFFLPPFIRLGINIWSTL